MKTFLTFIYVYLVTLLAYPLAPLAALLADANGRLPKGLQWLETHDNVGWAGPASESLPQTRLGLCRWLWRNKAYRFRNKFRADPTETELMYNYVEGVEPLPGTGFYWGYYKVGQWWEREYGWAFKRFKLYVRIGWKIKPYIMGHRPDGPTATGMIIPFSIRSDDWDD